MSADGDINCSVLQLVYVVLALSSAHIFKCEPVEEPVNHLELSNTS